MLQQHRRHNCGDRLRVSALSCSGIGSVVLAFNGAGSWNTKKSVRRAPDAIHSNAIRQGCYRHMADCDTGTMEWLVNIFSLCRIRYRMFSLGRKWRKKKHAIFMFRLFYYLPSDKVQIDDERHKGNQQHIINSNCIQRRIKYLAIKTSLISFLLCPIHPVVQFVSVANVQYPHEYQRFLNGVKLLDIDLGWMLSASCVVDIDFHDRLLFATIGPIVVILLLAMTYYIAARRNRHSEGAVQNVQHKHLSAVLLLTFFVYSDVSSILFQTFACEHLEDGKIYLRADYRIECDSAKHKKLQAYAAIMIIMYTTSRARSLRNLLVSGNECGRVFPAGVGPGSPSRDAANWLPSRFSLSVETRRRYGWLRMMVFPGARLFPSPNLGPFGRVAARERQGALSRRAW